MCPSTWTLSFAFFLGFPAHALHHASLTVIGDGAVGIADVIVRRLQTLRTQNEHTQHSLEDRATVCQIMTADDVKSMDGPPDQYPLEG